jgi:hypothetical protein
LKGWAIFITDCEPSFFARPGPAFAKGGRDKRVIRAKIESGCEAFLPIRARRGGAVIAFVDAELG